MNRFGKGEAWYLATWGDDAFLDAFHGALAARRGLRRALAADLPEGVCANVREGDAGRFVFVTNFASAPRTVALDAGRSYRDLLAGGATREGALELPPFGVAVLRELFSHAEGAEGAK